MADAEMRAEVGGDVQWQRVSATGDATALIHTGGRGAKINGEEISGYFNLYFMFILT